MHYCAGRDQGGFNRTWRLTKLLVNQKKKLWTTACKDPEEIFLFFSPFRRTRSQKPSIYFDFMTYTNILTPSDSFWIFFWLYSTLTLTHKSVTTDFHFFIKLNQIFVLTQLGVFWLLCRLQENCNLQTIFLNVSVSLTVSEPLLFLFSFFLGTHTHLSFVRANPNMPTIQQTGAQTKLHKANCSEKKWEAVKWTEQKRWRVFDQWPAVHPAAGWMKGQHALISTK